MSKLDKIIQLLIPPLLVLLLVVTIFELFYDMTKYHLLIDIFDVVVILIFGIDLYYRWFESKTVGEYFKKHYLDMIATIPFNFIFGASALTLTRAFRGIRILRTARYVRLLRLLRFGARSPRFLRMRKHTSKTKIRKVQPHQKKMKGVLSFRSILLITINSIMGTGIFFLTAAGAKSAGPASLIAWAILSLISVYIAMCFGELVSMFPKAGGVYEFAKQTYGRFVSFVIGWTTAIAGSVTIAMLLLGGLQYLIPLTYSYLYIPIAIAFIVLFHYIAYRGLKTGVFIYVILSLITIGTVLALIIPGLFRLQPGNFVPFFVFPSLSIVITIFIISETFFGWESAVFLSAETQNPEKIMPKALIWGTIVIAVLSFLLTLIGIGALSSEKFGASAAPLKDLGGVFFGSAGIIIFTILVFVSIMGAVAVWTLTAPRLLMSLAEDKLFFVQFAKVHPKHKSPYVSIIFQAIAISALVIIGSGSYVILLHMLIPLILLTYAAVLLGVVILRFKKPDVKRPYKVPFGKIGPLLTVLFMAFLLFMFIKETHGAIDVLRISLSLIVFGVPAYFAIEIFYEPSYVRLRRSLFAGIRHVSGEQLPSSLFKKITSLVGPFKGKIIVDYESSAGAFSKRIKNAKKIHVVVPSKNELRHIHHTTAKNHLRKTGQMPATKNVDVFVSFDSLGHVKHIPPFLKEVKKVLKKKGKFLFYVNHYTVTPNSLVLENKKKLVKMFHDAGLEVSYEKKKRLTGAYVILYGKK